MKMRTMKMLIRRMIGEFTLIVELMVATTEPYRILLVI